MNETRTERDSMGEVSLPAGAYWGAQTERARRAFRISGLKMPRELIRAGAQIKTHASVALQQLGELDEERATAIARAAREVAEGTWDDHFPLDLFQTGSGTSTNMNLNEVIANRANELLGSPLGSRAPVHPNDHVNKGQSSNDVIPTAIHIAVRRKASDLDEALHGLAAALWERARAMDDVLKPGRTHLQDAVPMTLGQEFSGYATQMEHGRERLRGTFAHLEELALGATAIGTGLNAPPGFAEHVIAALAEETGLPLRPAHNRFEALAARDALVALTGALNSIAVAVMKIANDLRLLSSGPRAGLAEITLPALQPGSSIMPGKINPVVPEALIQVSAQVMGAHLAVSVGGQHGPLELNMMMPMMAHNTLHAVEILGNGLTLLNTHCVAGVEADREKCAQWVEWSLANVTPLARRVGYDRAAAIAHRAWKERRTVRDVALDEGVLSAEEADQVLDPRAMLGPSPEAP